MMNEPHRGYIDLKSLHEFDYNTDLHLGVVRECRFLSFGVFSFLYGSVVLESFLDYLLALRPIDPRVWVWSVRERLWRHAMRFCTRCSYSLGWAGIPSEMDWRVARTIFLGSGLWLCAASSSCARTIQFLPAHECRGRFWSRASARAILFRDARLTSRFAL
jgi:hypothetical protein